MNTREQNWDIFRGISIWLVVLGHLVAEDSSLRNLIYVIHMPIFFLISGYFAYHSIDKYSLLEHFRRKSFSLLLPWFSWSAVALVMNCLKTFLSGEFTIHYLIQKFTEVYITTLSVWFLPVLWITTMLFLISYFILGSSKQKWLPFLFYLLVLMLPNTTIFSLNNVKSNAIWFLFGYLLHNIKLSAQTKKYLTMSGILYIPLYFVVFKLISVEEFYAYYTFQFHTLPTERLLPVISTSFLYTIVGILFVWNYIVPLVQKTVLKNLFLTYGLYSLDIYVMHMMFVSYIVLVPSFVAQNYYLCNYIYMPIYALLISSIIAFLSGRILYRIGIYNIFMRGKLKQK